MFYTKDESEKVGKEVINNLYFFPEIQMLDCNQYIIKDSVSNDLSLFDAGNGISLDNLFKGMESLNLNYENITKVFLSHEHVDHVLGLYKLLMVLKDNPPEIYAYGGTATILEKGEESKILPRMLGITTKQLGIEIFPLNVKDLVKTKEIQVTPDFNFEIHYTPGHSEGSACFYEPEKKILIPGDLVFIGGGFGRFDFPGGSLEKLIDSLKYVGDLDVKFLLPGHMGISESGNQQIELANRIINSFY
ncbi:MAG: MBL fold metallo-hydrolase [Promethearchaeota archaeon]|jgi:glyoxylase-like metal-dependent hydrolase (beta-lactamase superfamily II)